MIAVDVRSSKELQATILALRQMDRALRRRIYAETRAQITPDLREALATKARSKLDGIVIVGTARADVTSDRVTLRAGHLKKKLGGKRGGGATIVQVAHAVEFGVSPRARTVHGRSRKGTKYTYKRGGTGAFRPRRRAGYVFWPTVGDLIPRYLALWTQTTVRMMAEALEGKSDG